MSFSNEVKLELLNMFVKKNCCKKAFLAGIVFNAKLFDKNKFSVDFFLPEVAQTVAELLKSLYGASSVITSIQKPGKLYQHIEFSSSALASFFNELDINPDQSISELLPFRCPACEQAFLRGVFISIGKLNEPSKAYHLEFSLSKENLSRASKLYRFLSFSGFVAKITNRATTSGLYFKSNSSISDLLYFIGSVRSSFDYANSGIEKEIRNNENRATNCVTRNIYKSVSASHRHILAIQKLISSHRFDALPEELRITAKLRIDNEEATLSELAALHNPPISKSGINHRLDKICKEAELLEDFN